MCTEPERWWGNVRGDSSACQAGWYGAGAGTEPEPLFVGTPWKKNSTEKAPARNQASGEKRAQKRLRGAFTPGLEAFGTPCCKLMTLGFLTPDPHLNRNQPRVQQRKHPTVGGFGHFPSAQDPWQVYLQDGRGRKKEKEEGGEE
ncbi:unnamed protein product [Pleuronectes platessa]|uniref:Uncharacterized protein n=1 Tax=Pleuronectes platessa TaxID=8262 RepID=A0A9N7TWU1_PLEPL|nr:unnamed protein product [Pleuronectes platessa]